MSRKILLKSDFWYELPKELIAQEPVEPRDQSRLFVYDRQSGKIEHKKFFNLPDYLKKGDLLVINNTKVMRARLLGHKKLTQGKVEVFLLKKLTSVVEDNQDKKSERWQVMLGGKVDVGLEIVISPQLAAEVLADNNDGIWQVEFNLAGDELQAEVERIGHIPLPPYIRHGVDAVEDQVRYQTVFADESQKGSVAAPTAGLHFTEKLLDDIRQRGVEIGELTLHVGIGTFSPVKTEQVVDHRMHAEYFEVNAELVEKIIKTKKNGGRIIAVGTTSARTIETLASKVEFTELLAGTKKECQGFYGWTAIFIYPGYEYKLVDGLVTNFHLPESTLLMLLAAFLGQGGKKDGLAIERALYREAIENNYRFFSFGDGMLIL